MCLVTFSCLPPLFPNSFLVPSSFLKTNSLFSRFPPPLLCIAASPSLMRGFQPFHSCPDFFSCPSRDPSFDFLGFPTLFFPFFPRPLASLLRQTLALYFSELYGILFSHQFSCFILLLWTHRHLPAPLTLLGCSPRLFFSPLPFVLRSFSLFPAYQENFSCRMFPKSLYVVFFSDPLGPAHQAVTPSPSVKIFTPLFRSVSPAF